MTRADPQLNLRLPQRLKDKLEVSAAANRRSVTSEILIRLEGSYELPIAEHIDLRGVSEEVLATAVAEGIRLAREQVAGARSSQENRRGTRRAAPKTK